MLLCYVRQTRAGRPSDSIPCVQRFHCEEILSEGTKSLSGTPKFECGVFARDSLIRKVSARAMSGVNYCTVITVQ